MTFHFISFFDPEETVQWESVGYNFITSLIYNIFLSQKGCEMDKMDYIILKSAPKSLLKTLPKFFGQFHC